LTRNYGTFKPLILLDLVFLRCGRHSGRCLRSFVRKPENDEYETHSTGNHQSLVLTRANNAGNPQTGAGKRTSDQTAFFGND
jgi:hypothetical protein